MSKLGVVKNPNEVLRRKSLPVELSRTSDKDFQTMVDDMIETMNKENGVGIAAPQVGESQRVIIALDGDTPLALVNPELSNLSFAKVASEEGCLSVPGVWGIVKRHRTVDWSAYDRTGKKIEGRAKGLFAIVLQHEIDHLDGILFIDRVEKYISESSTAI